MSKHISLSINFEESSMEKLHMRMRISIELARSCQSTETSVKKTYKKYILKNHHFRLPSSKMRQLQSRRDIFNSNYNNVFRSCKYMRFILLYWVGFFSLVYTLSIIVLSKSRNFTLAVTPKIHVGWRKTRFSKFTFSTIVEYQGTTTIMQDFCVAFEVA